MSKRILLMVAIFIFFFPVNVYGEESNLIRLHVIANSDNEADQNLKFIIRDQVLRELESLINTTSLSEAKKYIEESIPLLQNELESEISENGFSYPILINFTESDFPVRKYNNIVLPSGKYLALKIIIGEGKGANWWCVLFPPICHGDLVQEPQKKMVNEESAIPVMKMDKPPINNSNLNNFSKKYMSLLTKVWSFSKSP